MFEEPLLFITVSGCTVVGVTIAVSVMRSAPAASCVSAVTAYGSAAPPSSSAAPSVPTAATFASDTKVTRYCPGASVTPVVPEAVMLPVELMEFAGSDSVPPAATVCASVL